MLPQQACFVMVLALLSPLDFLAKAVHFVFQLLSGTEAEQLLLLGGTTVTLLKGESGSYLLFNMGEGNVFELIDQVDNALRKV